MWSSLYYHAASESAENLMLMRLIDERYLATPFYGTLRMTAGLNRLDQWSEPVDVKRVRRLMRQMGLEAIYPRPHKKGLSQADREARRHPCLLRKLVVDRLDQVWASDICPLSSEVKVA